MLNSNKRILLRAIFVFLATHLVCVHAQSDSPVGLSLLFLNKGPDAIGVTRFDPDGKNGPVPGALGASPIDGAHMTFMPGNSKRGVPQFVEVGWLVSTPDIVSAENELDKKFKQYSSAWMDGIKGIQAIAPRHTRHVDLTTVITPELLAKVRANRSTTNLKMTVIFKGDDVTLIAETEVWNRLKHSASDDSPAASAERKADFIAGSTRVEHIFYAHGYYVGQVNGALKGTLTISVHVDGTVSAVIASVDQPAIVLNGVFDIASSDTVRTLKLTGNSAQGTTTLTGQIDLKARSLKGEWTTTPTTTNAPSLSGNFAATR